MREATIQIETYSWGQLTKIERGGSFRAILHPEHLEALELCGSFRDEQRIRWTCEELPGGGRRLRGRPGELEISASGLAKILEAPKQRPGACSFCGNCCAALSPWTCSHCGVTYPALTAEALEAKEPTFWICDPDGELRIGIPEGLDD